MTLALAVGLLATACGSGSSAKSTSLDATCGRDRAALARVGPIEDLGDAESALRKVLRLERHTLADVEAAGRGDERVAGRFRLAIATTERSLRTIVGSDPQQTMTPLRTAVPDARRAAGDAATIVESLCGSRNA